MDLSPYFNTLTAVWGASEIWLGLRKRSADRTRQRDGGTLRLLMVTIYLCIALGVWLSYLRPWPVTEPPRVALFLIGMAMMAAGMLFRWWSIRVLAEYRWLRHPSYTGALATFYGFALCLGDIAALLVIVVPVTLGFLWRIRVEEAVLAQAFPDDYPAYASQTKRLLPHLW